MKRHGRLLTPFRPSAGKPQQSQGGVRAEQENANAVAQQTFRGPGLGARIYTPTAMKIDDNDPRYVGGKSDNVENIYVPVPAPAPRPRPGIAQIFNWLTKGELR